MNAANTRITLARRFFAAVEHGDLASLEALLAADVKLTGDGGGKALALERPLHGRARVAGTLGSWVREGMQGRSLRRVEVNGSPGVLLLDANRRVVGVVALDIAGGEIRGISYIVNPDKLTHLARLGDYAALLRSAR